MYLLAPLFVKYKYEYINRSTINLHPTHVVEVHKRKKLETERIFQYFEKKRKYSIVIKILLLVIKFIYSASKINVVKIPHGSAK